MDTTPLAPRYLSAQEAAFYTGVSVDTFLAEVKRGIWPQPFKRGKMATKATWDRKAIDAAIDRQSGIENLPAPIDTVIDPWEARLNGTRA